MKYMLPLLSSLLINVSCHNSSTQSKVYAKEELKKISWIAGNWKGMDGQNPFYEVYQFVNDTTVEITSYEWDGTDSSHSSKNLLSWKNDQYYLGDSLNYRVIAITDSSISMDPNFKANNSILWKTKNSNAWLAILKSKNGQKTYNMERINHFNHN